MVILYVHSRGSRIRRLIPLRLRDGDSEVWAGRQLGIRCLRRSYIAVSRRLC